MSYTPVDFVRREVGRLLRGAYQGRFLCAPCLTRLVRDSLRPTDTKGQIERGLHAVFRSPGALTRSTPASHAPMEGLHRARSLAMLSGEPTRHSLRRQPFICSLCLYCFETGRS